MQSVRQSPTRPSAPNWSLAPGPATPDATTDFIASGFQFDNPAIDRAPCQPAGRGNRGHPAAAERYRLIGRKQPTPPLVQERRHPLKPSENAVDVNHNHKISLCITLLYDISIRSLRSLDHFDSIISRQVLRRNDGPPSSHIRGYYDGTVVEAAQVFEFQGVGIEGRARGRANSLSSKSSKTAWPSAIWHPCTRAVSVSGTIRA
jgi:hypothetical protein